jgi:hypothetical protein
MSSGGFRTIQFQISNNDKQHLFGNNEIITYICSHKTLFIWKSNFIGMVV